MVAPDIQWVNIANLQELRVWKRVWGGKGGEGKEGKSNSRDSRFPLLFCIWKVLLSSYLGRIFAKWNVCVSGWLIHIFPEVHPIMLYISSITSWTLSWTSTSDSYRALAIQYFLTIPTVPSPAAELMPQFLFCLINSCSTMSAIFVRPWKSRNHSLHFAVKNGSALPVISQAFHFLGRFICKQTRALLLLVADTP